MEKLKIGEWCTLYHADSTEILDTAEGARSRCSDYGPAVWDRVVNGHDHYRRERKHI